MSAPLILAALWVIAATVIAMLPSKDRHWRAAYGLIAVGVPILVAVFWVNGPWAAVFVLLAGMSVLRWPVVHLWRWLRRKLG